jgi:uncharacterized protein (DUF4213/DUF364 family)
MSEILQQTVELARRIDAALELPAVSAVHLPRLVDEPEKPDEFGFVFLEDGSVGPFYTRLDDDLARLWQTIPDGASLTGPVMDLVSGWLSHDQARRALALGAFNALSHHLMRRAGFSPVAAQGGKRKSKASSLAMVGYIRPMVEKLLERGLDHVLVLERNPARVDDAPGVRLSTNPADLFGYDEIVCTASTLINDSLGEIAANKNPRAQLALVGPSGSGLPDVLFDHGVDEVGGIWIEDLPALREALTAQQSWGHAGSKYGLTPESYPGLDKLLEQALGRAR